MVRPAGFEPATPCSEDKCSNPLSYRRASKFSLNLRVRHDLRRYTPQTCSPLGPSENLGLLGNPCNFSSKPLANQCYNLVMLTLLIGQDLFAKQGYLDAELEKHNAEVIKHQDSAQAPILSSLEGPSLFGGATAHVFIGLLKDYELPDLEKAASSQSLIYFWEESLDKRLTKTKALQKIATVKEFLEPDAHSAGNWIVKHAEENEIKIQPSAATALAARLMGETKQTLSVSSAHNELLKLSTYAGGNAITVAMVEELTPQDLSIDIFGLLNHVASGNKSLAMEAIKKYYQNSSEDDKVLTIRLVALLSDQLRSLLIAKQLSSQGLSEQQILTATGWKSGRLFVMNKLGRNFSEHQLNAGLTKLYNLDKELKSSTLPPRAVMDLIIAAI